MSTAITDRYQFPVYPDRAAFKAASGHDAPAWNPSYPIKQWFDPTGTGSYEVLNGSDTSPALVPMTIPSAEAKTVNLPGTPTFDIYVPAPTPATQTITVAGHSWTTAIDPSTLSTLAQATELSAICGASVVDPDSAPNQFFSVAWNGEARRRYKLEFGGDPNKTSFVGQILQQQNRQGIGHPGHWDASQFANGMVFVFDAVPDGAGVTATVPIPVALQPGEKLSSVMVGPGIFTVVVDQGGALIPVTGNGGGFTDDDRTKLVAIYKATGGQ